MTPVFRGAGTAGPRHPPPAAITLFPQAPATLHRLQRTPQKPGMPHAPAPLIASPVPANRCPHPWGEGTRSQPPAPLGRSLHAGAITEHLLRVLILLFILLALFNSIQAPQLLHCGLILGVRDIDMHDAHTSVVVRLGNVEPFGVVDIKHFAVPAHAPASKHSPTSLARAVSELRVACSCYAQFSRGRSHRCPPRAR